MSGHHVGRSLGSQATFPSYVLNGVTTLRFRGDRVAERWSSADMLGLLIEIGAIPPPMA